MVTRACLEYRKRAWYAFGIGVRCPAQPKRPVM